MGEVLKGTVLSVNGDRCRVAPMEDIDQVSPKIMIPNHLGEISKGDTVAYTMFGDYTGIILSVMEA